MAWQWHPGAWRRLHGLFLGIALGLAVVPQASPAQVSTRAEAVPEPGDLVVTGWASARYLGGG